MALGAIHRGQALFNRHSARASDVLDRRRILEGGDVTDFLPEMRGADDAAHDLGIARLWQAAHELHLARRERRALARLDSVWPPP